MEVLCNTCSNLKGFYDKKAWYGQEHKYHCKATWKFIYPLQEQSARLYMVCPSYLQGEPDLKEITEMERKIRLELSIKWAAEVQTEEPILRNCISDIREIKER